jgi:hypothetical protein
MRIRAALLVAACLAGATRVALAQDAVGTITGTVRDEAGHPIANADVAALPGTAHTHTDSAGHFALTPLDGGSYRVRVRHLGYLVNDAAADLPDHGKLDLTFELKIRPAILDTVVVEADGNCAALEFGGFNCRKTRGHGTYLTDDDIADRGENWLGEVFGGVRGFRVDSTATPFGRMPVPVPMVGQRCLAALVNGRPVSLTNQPPRWADQLLGVEIYSSASDVPKEYERYVWHSTPLSLGGAERSGTRCSLVVYWTAYSG